MSIETSETPVKDITFVAFDIETTGLSPIKDRIVEIGAVKFKNQKIIDAYLPLSRQLRWTTSLILKLPERQQESNREHSEIFTAFQEKKTGRLRKLIEKHAKDHVNRVLVLMESE